MSGKKTQLDPAFLDRQRGRLTALRQQLLAARQDLLSEQASASPDGNTEPREYEDDAQKLTTLELEGNLTAALDGRSRHIERALQKLAEGTYGLSDSSGKPIPLERLEAFPEALYTLEEQKARDGER